jgi:hypothetical protein
MKRRVVFGMACGVGIAGAVDFEKPVRLTAGDELIGVESPGYASPCLADMDGDGKKDLLVGQFNKGKIRVFRNLGDLKFGEGKWLEAGGKIAEVPGVW